MDYNEMMEEEARRHKEWLYNMHIFERMANKVFVGHRLRLKHRVPRWYNVHLTAKGREYIMWRGIRLYLDEIDKEAVNGDQHQEAQASLSVQV